MKMKSIIGSILLVAIVICGIGYAYDSLNDKPTVITLPEDQLPDMTVNTTSVTQNTSVQMTAPKNVDVGILAYTFAPPSVVISSGGTVRWINYDQLPHNVQGSGFNSGMIYHGYTYSFTFDNPGIYNYNSSVHSNMQGTINVV